MAGVSAGQIVGGKYRLEAPIGQGGMASVWRAVHTTLESPVAVKFLETFGTGRNDTAKRFLREAKLAAGLRHRNVVHILDHGVLDDGQPFMVMELLAGTSLADRMEADPPLREVELFDIAAMVLSGLAVVHDAGIVHRDVKPDNIFLVRDADGDYPKLLDFGISRGMDTSAANTRMTNTGAVIGTPLYMSPEQARGLRDLDQRTDLWSVGMVLYEGLTGSLPFECENMGDVLVQVVTQEVPRLEGARPDLPPVVAEVVHRALARDRERRFQSAREMRDAVLAAAEALAQLQPVAVRPLHSVDRRARSRPPADMVDTGAEIQGTPPRKRRGAIAIAVGATLALGLAIGGFVVLGARIRIETDDDRQPPVASPAPRTVVVEEEPVRTNALAARPVPTPEIVEVPTTAEVAPAPEAIDAAPTPPRLGRPAARTTSARRAPAKRLAPAATSHAPSGSPEASPSGRRPFLRDLDY